MKKVKSGREDGYGVLIKNENLMSDSQIDSDEKNSKKWSGTGKELKNVGKRKNRNKGKNESKKQKKTRKKKI